MALHPFGNRCCIVGILLCFPAHRWPLVAPGIVTVALFAFIASWNAFIGALILMNP